MECKRILVVDDDQTTAKIIELQLIKMGFTVASIAKSGQEAIDKARTCSPDLMLMDIKLGNGIDGIEAARIITQKYHVPVIYLTAYADENTLARALDTHPLGYVNKPLRETDLRTTISLALSKMGPEKISEEPPASNKKPWQIRIACDKEGKITRVFQSTRGIMEHPGEENIQYIFPDSHVKNITECLQNKRERLVFNMVNSQILSFEYIPFTDSNLVNIVISDRTVANLLGEKDSLYHANLLDTLNHLTAGIILFNENMNIFYSNDSAKALLNSTSVLENYNGYLSSRNPEITADLRKLVLDQKDHLLSIGSDDDQNTLNILVTSLQSYNNNFGKNLPTSILFAFGQMDNTDRIQEVIRGLYRLSPTEARLVSELFINPHLATAAKTLGITHNTARTHLKRIYNKTGVNRISSLVHMIVTGPASTVINTNG